jgi:hypothetical protein
LSEDYNIAFYHLNISQIEETNNFLLGDGISQTNGFNEPYDCS